MLYNSVITSLNSTTSKKLQSLTYDIVLYQLLLLTKAKSCVNKFHHETGLKGVSCFIKEY